MNPMAEISFPDQGYSKKRRARFFLLLFSGLFMLLAACHAQQDGAPSSGPPSSQDAVPPAVQAGEDVAGTASSGPMPQTPLSREEYFAVQRPFVQNETAASDAAFICSLEDDLLLVTDQISGDCFSPVHERVRTFWRFGNLLYINGFDTGLIEYDLSARASKVLYADSKIASISLNSEVAFFVENCTANRFYSGLELDTALSAGESAIHRPYLPSGQDEIIYKADGIAVCRPVSNQVIQIAVDNPEFIEYLLETGDLNNGANIPEYQWYLYNIADQTEQPYDPRLEDPNFWGSKK